MIFFSGVIFFLSVGAFWVLSSCMLSSSHWFMGRFTNLEVVLLPASAGHFAI